MRLLFFPLIFFLLGHYYNPSFYILAVVLLLINISAKLIEIAIRKERDLLIKKALESTKEECPPHKWEYVGTTMVCKICKMRPNS